MALTEADTRAKLIDPAIHKRGWTEDLIRREETAGSIEIVGGKARRRTRGRVDYVLRVKVNPNTQPVAVEEYKARLAAKLVEQAHTLEEFRSLWVNPPSRRELIDALVTAGYSPNVVRMVDEKEEYDLYDVLAELGWGVNPRTRSERALAFTYKHEAWLNALPAETKETIKAIASQFERGGTEGLENPQIFQTPEVKTAGGLEALKSAGKPAELLRETKVRMFAA